MSSSYAQSTPYFVFQSILTLISSFFAIIILTIHWIEYNKSKYILRPRDRTPSSPITSTKRSKPAKLKLKKFTAIQTTIRYLSCSSIIIFCAICIIYSCLTIIEQVGRPNTIILCNQWTVRIVCAAFQIGVGSMNCLFIAQLHTIYSNTQFAYYSFTLKICTLIIVILSIISSILIMCYLNVQQYSFKLIDVSITSCTIVISQFLYISIGIIEFLIFVCIIYLFVRPMQAMVSLHKSKEIDVSFSDVLIKRVNKMTTLTLISSICTFISVVIIGWSNMLWIALIVMPLNCVCLLFMTDFYPNGYQIFCFLVILCRSRLFRKVNESAIKSMQLYHANRASTIIDLKSMDIVQKETEAYLDGNGDANMETLMPPIQSGYDLVTDASASEHVLTNSTELRIMDDINLNKSISNDVSSSYLVLNDARDVSVHL